MLIYILTWGGVFSSGEISGLAEMDSLVQLGLEGVDGKMIEFVGGLTQLKHLSVFGRAKGIANCLDVLSNRLAELRLDSAAWKDVGDLARQRQMKTLSFSNMRGAVSRIELPDGLQSLDIDQCTSGGDGLELIGGQLQLLSVSNIRGLDSMPKCRWERMRRFSVCLPRVTDLDDLRSTSIEDLGALGMSGIRTVAGFLPFLELSSSRQLRQRFPSKKKQSELEGVCRDNGVDLVDGFMPFVFR